MLVFDRREYTRFLVHQYMRIININESPLCFGQTLNVSRMGISGVCEKELSQGVDYKLMFNLMAQKNMLITISGVVVYSYFSKELHGFRTGFKFCSDEDIMKIHAWVRYMETESESCLG